jgi:hypothetical protein
MFGAARLAEVELAIRERRFGDAGKPLRDRAYVPRSKGGFTVTKGERNMLFVTRFVVRKHERGLLYKNGDFLKFLPPGIYRFIDPGRRYAVERLDLTKPAFEHRLADYLLQTQRAAVERLFEVVETSPGEAALVYHNGRLAAVLGPAERRLYGKGVVSTHVERFDLTRGPEIDTRVAARLFAGGDERATAGFDHAVHASVVPESHVGLLYVDGELAATLPAGRHAFWRYEHNVTVDLVDLRVKTLEVVRDTLTRDNVALRVTLTCTYQVVDAAKAARAVQDPSGYLRKEIQLGLRAAVGGRTLEALLEDERAIDREVVAHLRERFAAIGIAVLGAGVQDMWLPGDAQRPSNAPEAPD